MNLTNLLKTVIVLTLVLAGLACDRSGPRAVRRASPSGTRESADLPPPPAPSLPEAIYQGRYVVGPETRWFTPCGSDERWWVSRELDEVTRFIAQYPKEAGPPGWDNARVLLKVRAVPSATGNFGRLGKYSRELNVLEILEIREFRAGDCALKGAAQ